jgi:serine O-acetyltransferase
MNFADIVNQLSDISDSELYHYGQESTPFPSADELRDIVDLCRDLLFPGYYGRNLVKAETLSYYIGVKTERLYEKLSKQILAGIASLSSRFRPSVSCWPPMSSHTTGMTRRPTTRAR